jgi:anti-sigma regulatory factor (Ser/Thr protein kinase)
MEARHGDARLELSIPGSAEGLREATAAFDRFSVENGFPDDARRSVQIVLDELLSNTVRCGSAGRAVTIELAFRLASEVLEVVVTDDAAPFDPFAPRSVDTTSSLDKRAIGGLGLMLVRELVDAMRYTCEGGRNRVMLEKRF